MIQDSMFEKSEADNYFLRNKESMLNLKCENDRVIQAISKLENKNKIK